MLSSIVRAQQQDIDTLAEFCQACSADITSSLDHNTDRAVACNILGYNIAVVVLIQNLKTAHVEHDRLTG